MLEAVKERGTGEKSPTQTVTLPSSFHSLPLGDTGHRARWMRGLTQSMAALMLLFSTLSSVKAGHAGWRVQAQGTQKLGVWA